ncbi:hypothetical protein PanWU01x14_298780, partial [Parasponia andersonii]
TKEFLLQLPLKGFQRMSLIEESSISIPHVEGGHSILHARSTDNFRRQLDGSSS